MRHIHGLGYVHNDIKIENILVRDPATLSGIKICDFGISKLKGERAPVETSWYNMCPETVRAIMADNSNPHTLLEHTEKLDIWPVGIVLYQLLTGLRMFYDPSDQNQDSVLHRIASVSMASWNTVHIKANFRKAPTYRFVDSNLTSFLRSIFKNYPAERPTAAGLLESAWLEPVLTELEQARLLA